jgi:FkbM family methyltransferase
VREFEALSLYLPTQNFRVKSLGHHTDILRAIMRERGPEGLDKSRRVLARVKNLAIYWLSKSGLTFLRSRNLQRYLEIEFDRKKLFRELAFIDRYGIDARVDFARLRAKSKSQLGQDLWVVIGSSFKRNGTFLEIGGADGIAFSNTHLLEKEFGWSGVVVEPARIWQEDLRRNRSCVIDSRCCTSESGNTIEFLETPSPMLSTIEKFKNLDTHSHERRTGKSYSVETVSLNSLFLDYFPSGQIDYLSIDTEGNEEDILRAFNFSRFSFKFASIENAFDIEKSKRIEKLLTSNGYVRVLREVSEFDDYYEKR